MTSGETLLTAFRIVKQRHAGTAFDGEGAARAGGRWNSRGVRVVYASATKALCALEILVHLPTTSQLAFVVFPLGIPPQLVQSLPKARLPAGWRTMPPGTATQQLGDAWVASGSSAVLAVPSVLTGETNYLLNPAHPDFARIQIGRKARFVLDPRLLG